MDLSAHLQVLSRHRVLIAIGLTVATMAALLSYVSIGPTGVHFRANVKWQSTTRLFGTTNGALAPSTNVAQIDPTGLVAVVAEFVNSDNVKAYVKRTTGVDLGEEKAFGLEALPAVDLNGSFLPFIDVTGVGPNPDAARRLARRGAQGMERYMAQRQAAGHVPRNRQVVFQVVSEPTTPKVREGRPKGPTMFIFLAISFLAVATAYVRENFRGERSATGPARAQNEAAANSGDGLAAVSESVHDGPRAAVPLQQVASSDRRSTNQPYSRPQTLALERRSEDG